MKLPGHGPDKFPNGRLLQSSAGRSWEGLFAERRFHPAGELPAYTPPFTEVAILIRGRSIVSRKAAQTYQRFDATQGTIWLCPAGLKEDFTVISRDITEALHLYLPSNPFEHLATSRECPAAADARLRYCAGFRDPLIEQLANGILMEMHFETSAGRLLVESLAGSLVARLLQRYSTALDQPADSSAASRGLERRRLQRVFDFIESHLEDDFAVAQLASTANLSQFHFSRAFKAATGRSPHQYVSARRLEHAKTLLAATDRALLDIALSCQFSSHANFSRAFRRATGITPAQYRAGGGNTSGQLQAGWSATPGQSALTRAISRDCHLEPDTRISARNEQRTAALESAPLIPADA